MVTGTEVEAHELKLYSQSHAGLYRRQYEPILKNLERKKARGIYDSTKAAKLMKYYADNAAREYGKEHAGGQTEGLRMFSPLVRRKVAAELRDEYEEESNRGNYRNLHPKNCMCPFHGGHPGAKVPAMRGIGRRLPSGRTGF